MSDPFCLIPAICCRIVHPQYSPHLSVALDENRKGTRKMSASSADADGQARKARQMGRSAEYCLRFLLPMPVKALDWQKSSIGLQCFGACIASKSRSACSGSNRSGYEYTRNLQIRVLIAGESSRAPREGWSARRLLSMSRRATSADRPREGSEAAAGKSVSSYCRDGATSLTARATWHDPPLRRNGQSCRGGGSPPDRRDLKGIRISTAHWAETARVPESAEREGLSVLSPQGSEKKCVVESEPNNISGTRDTHTMR